MKSKKPIYFLLAGIIVIVAFFANDYLLPRIFNKHSLPDELLDDRGAFSESLRTWGEASDITNKSGENATQEQTNSVISLTNQSITNSKKVSNEFLDYLDPQLKEKYRNVFIQGQILYLDGIRESKEGDTIASQSVIKQMQGSQLIKEWLDWWNPKSDALVNKAFTN